jgi:hypothetical protein
VGGPIWEELHMTLRASNSGREASPTVGVIDSQALKAAEKGAVTLFESGRHPLFTNDS